MSSTIYNVELNIFDSEKNQHQNLGQFQSEAYENKDLEKIIVFKSKLLVNQIIYNLKYIYCFKKITVMKNSNTLF